MWLKFQFWCTPDITREMSHACLNSAQCFLPTIVKVYLSYKNWFKLMFSKKGSPPSFSFAEEFNFCLKLKEHFQKSSHNVHWMCNSLTKHVTAHQWNSRLKAASTVSECAFSRVPYDYHFLKDLLLIVVYLPTLFKIFFLFFQMCVYCVFMRQVGFGLQSWVQPGDCIGSFSVVQTQLD